MPKIPRHTCLAFATLFSVAAMLADPQAWADETPPTGRSVIEGSVLAMGGAVPSSSVMLGSVELTEGSLSESGMIRIATRGMSASKETMALPSRTDELVYSNGRASRLIDGVLQKLPKEQAMMSETLGSPLWRLGEALQDPNTQFEYVATESTPAGRHHHVKLWRTFAGEPGLEGLAALSAIDVWIDVSTMLPARFHYDLVVARGTSIKVPHVVELEGYQDFANSRYPTRIVEHVNGSLWRIVTVSSVSVDGDLSAESFPIE